MTNTSNKPRRDEITENTTLPEKEWINAAIQKTIVEIQKLFKLYVTGYNFEEATVSITTNIINDKPVDKAAPLAPKSGTSTKLPIKLKMAAEALLMINQ